ERHDLVGVAARVERHGEVLLGPRVVAHRGEGAAALVQLLDGALALHELDVGAHVVLRRRAAAAEGGAGEHETKPARGWRRTMAAHFFFFPLWASTICRLRFDSHVVYSASVPLLASPCSSDDMYARKTRNSPSAISQSLVRSA